MGRAQPANKPKAPFTLLSCRAVVVAVVAAIAIASGSQLIRPRVPARPTPAGRGASAGGSMGASLSHPSASLAASINSFGNELFDRLASEAGDGRFLSPFGISQALGMLLNGVQPGGESYRQLQSVVFGGGEEGDALTLESVNTQLSALSAALNKPASDDLTVSDANSAWLATRYQLQAGYAQALKSVFGTAAQPLTSAAAVNDWVSEATRGKITSIVDDGVAAQAVLILVNAVYFKGLWLHQFSKSATHTMDFHPLQHGAVPMQAATMFHTFKGKSAVQVAKLAAKAGDAAFECAAVQLPYRGDEFYAVAALPTGELAAQAAEGGERALAVAGGKVVPYRQALKACRQAVLASLPGGVTADSVWHVPRADVKVYLPRFEVEFKTSLAESLQALGITRPFVGGDITQIAADASGAPVGDLVVSDVVHKVYAKVDEEGTEAAAATAVVMLRSMPMPREEIELRFDRPFVFAIVHKQSGLALFSGEVYRPEAWTGKA